MANTVFLRGKPIFQPTGLLGEALAQSASGRLKSFIVGPESEPAALFGAEAKSASAAGDWYGEHAGKWLIAASRSAFRTGDEELRDRVLRIADYLLRCQEPDGYLGTYALDAPCRFTNAAAESHRTWDVWTHAYTVLGLLEVHRYWPDAALVEACQRVAELLQDVFVRQGRDITRYGNHAGLSSLIVIHPLAELSLATGDQTYAQLAEALVQQGESCRELRPLDRLLNGEDVAAIGTGKAYQLLWLLVGLARLHAATGRQDLLGAAKAGWNAVRENHLTLGGGPWGGVGRHKEVLNDPGFFSPYGLVETCSAMAWMQLNRALFEENPDAKYVDEVERTLYNSILGAMDPSGEDWCYFTFPNGRRNWTYSWACCKSSGAIALEEAALMAGAAPRLAQHWAGGLESEDLQLEVETLYPLEGDVLYRWTAKGGTVGKVEIAIPGWARKAVLQIDGEAGPAAIPGAFVQVDLSGKSQAAVRLELPLNPEIRAAVDTLDHHGQEIVHRDYFAVTRGPLVFATGLIDGYKTEETLRAPKLDLHRRLEAVAGPQDGQGPTLRLTLPGRAPIDFRPYFEAGGRRGGTWRSTWMGVAWQ